MRLLLASSSTGGHIYPALAIAAEVRARDPDAEILFVSASWEIGKDIVGRYGYAQTFIDAQGFDRRNPFNNISTLRSLVRSSRQIKKIFRDFRPDIVMGTGGHVAGPVIRAARKQGIQAVIQEQNVLPGLANRLAERYADRVFVAFPEAAEHFKEKDKIVVSGNPVRAEFFALDREEARADLGIPEGNTAVFIFGGSQGASRINEAAIDVIKKLGGGKGYTILFATGPQLYDEVLAALVIPGADPGSMDSVHVMDYADPISRYYSAADLIVSRAGALTVSEVAAAGRASILIPSPNVVGNHQLYNAKALEDLGAALILDESEIADGGLAEKIEELAGDPGKLRAMGEAAKRGAKPDAVKVIVDELFGTNFA
ncbi:MAG: undecaprenyldiphospho-muramoylpentapeptide beta-N-acetylglucosaminyltransferase [Clostridiales Family XIII bacterium]|jgi:UDP-N-acetylglucosamine--N-acetylmuramyl-(pentapeptide) pyrophosphoryl-undecaprenol N-acetylglucosamine transferase|nr:undecaprenyldiphospho-muramoylpentapeptide beta-N-acetylglucosaminyltransferase [Clostridiales Family XIII bacterium]